MASLASHQPQIAFTATHRATQAAYERDFDKSGPKPPIPAEKGSTFKPCRVFTRSGPFLTHEFCNGTTQAGFCQMR